MMIGQPFTSSGRRRIEQDGGAPFRRQPDRMGAGKDGNGVAPGAGGVDDEIAAELVALGAYPPSRPVARKVENFRVAHEARPRPRRAAQKAAVDFVNVEIVRRGFEHAAGHVVGLEHGRDVARFVAFEPADGRHQLDPFIVCALQLGQLIAAGNHHRVALLPQRILAKSCGRRGKEPTRPHGQPADGGIAVDLGEHRGRPSSRMISGLGLCVRG